MGEIYAELDAYTIEYFEDEPQFHERIDLRVLLPPLRYEGQFLKGVCFSQGVDYLVKLHPQLPQLFLTIANSQWYSYPWSREADACFTCYPNGHREAWFRQANPDRADKILLPLQSADFTHDYALAPVPFLPKDFDVICVSRLHDLKNLPLIASALKVYRRKYRPIRMALVAGKEFDLNFKGLDPEEQAELRKVEEILEHPHDYIEFIPRVKYFEQLPGYLSRSRLYVLGALLEGKNRALYEAMSCNTPVVCFRQFNQYARGGRSRQRSAIGGQPIVRAGADASAGVPRGRGAVCPGVRCRIPGGYVSRGLAERDQFPPAPTVPGGFRPQEFLQPVRRRLSVLPDRASRPSGRPTPAKSVVGFGGSGQLPVESARFPVRPESAAVPAARRADHRRDSGLLLQPLRSNARTRARCRWKLRSPDCGTRWTTRRSARSPSVSSPPSTETAARRKRTKQTREKPAKPLTIDGTPKRDHGPATPVLVRSSSFAIAASVCVPRPLAYARKNLR